MCRLCGARIEHKKCIIEKPSIFAFEGFLKLSLDVLLEAMQSVILEEKTHNVNI